MTITALGKQLGLESLTVTSRLAPRYSLRGLKAPLKEMVGKIAEATRKGTVTVEQIDSFIHEHLDLLGPSQKQRLLAFLLSKKAFLLLRDGYEEESLKAYEQALEVAEEPSTWALKGAALLQMDRTDEAFDAFRNAFLLRDRFGLQKREYLSDLIVGWSTGALLRGLFGILEQDVSEAQKGVEEYINVSSKARAEGLEASVMPLEVEKPVPTNLNDAMEELKLMVRLLSIEDPFDGWRELSKEVSKVWPEGLSAVDAIREQRA